MLRRLYPKLSSSQQYIHFEPNVRNIFWCANGSYCICRNTTPRGYQGTNRQFFTHLQHLFEDSIFMPKPPKRRKITTVYVREPMTFNAASSRFSATTALLDMSCGQSTQSNLRAGGSRGLHINAQLASGEFCKSGTSYNVRIHCSCTQGLNF